MPTPAQIRWSVIVDDLEASGLTARAFARARGLNVNTLAWWRARIRREPIQRPPTTPRFAELTVSEAKPPPRREDTRREPPALILSLDAYGARLRVDAATDLTLLRGVLEALC